MVTSRLLAVVEEAKPCVEYRHFMLLDEDGRIDTPEGWPDDAHFAAGAGRGVLLGSGGNDFHPLVRIEAWSAEPPQQEAGAWESTSEADFVSETGNLYVREWDRGLVEGPIATGSTGRHRVRAYCKGRAEARALIGKDLYYEGVEEWLLQVWPLND
ncbi:hypothetical protein [Streptomyces luteocolor]|uniref:hypothetical protein n=1 Tax=Streptomyces luteocolor TaxID=285500 RepID=UPI00114CEAF3|nr:hypothetical protein [Streptomyces luteocolor]